MECTLFCWFLILPVYLFSTFWSSNFPWCTMAEWWFQSSYMKNKSICTCNSRSRLSYHTYIWVLWCDWAREYVCCRERACMSGCMLDRQTAGCVYVAQTDGCLRFSEHACCTDWRLSVCQHILMLRHPPHTHTHPCMHAHAYTRRDGAQEETPAAQPVWFFRFRAAPTGLDYPRSLSLSLSLSLIHSLVLCMSGASFLPPFLLASIGSSSGHRVLSPSRPLDSLAISALLTYLCMRAKPM